MRTIKNKLQCPNCKQYKIRNVNFGTTLMGTGMILIYLGAFLCIFIITIPLAIVFFALRLPLIFIGFIIWLATRKQKGVYCIHCHWRGTKDEALVKI
jgi:uncharacterized metal-binding protein